MDVAKIGSFLKEEDPLSVPLVFLTSELHLDEEELQHQEEETDNEYVSSDENYDDCFLCNEVSNSKKNSIPRIKLHKNYQWDEEAEETEDSDDNEEIDEIDEDDEVGDIILIKRTRRPSPEAARAPIDDPLHGIGLIRSMLLGLSTRNNDVIEQPERPQSPCPIHGAAAGGSMPYCEDIVESELPPSSALTKEDLKIPMSEDEVARMDPIKIYLIHKHLLVLLHAHYSYRMEMMLHIQQPEDCDVPILNEMEVVVKHMQDCKDKVDCSVALCAISWRIIGHFESCGKYTCPICKPFIKKTETCCNGNND